MRRAPLATAALLLASACASLPRAANQGDLAQVEQHLASGQGGANARFDDGGCSGCTLLHFAAGGGRVEVARLLLDKGADPNLADSRGMTPLHVACANQEVEAARFLLAHGAKPSLAMRDAWGNSPLLLAVAHRKESDAWVFTPAGAVATTARASGPSLQLVELLLAEGAPLEAATSKGNTALHIAAYKGYGDAVRVLLARGADRKARNAAGATPEMLAVQFGKADVAALLRAP